MRIAINLASEPFRRDRPIFVASVALCVVLAALLGVLTYLVVLQRNQAADAREALARMDQEIRNLMREQSKYAAITARPENAAVVEQSLFLNVLLARKGISWTRMFADLEGVVPHNVRVISVRPQVNGLNQVQLDLFVGSQAAEPVIDMLMRLEASPLFGKTTIVNSLPPSQTEPLYRYRLTVNYEQRL